MAAVALLVLLAGGAAAVRVLGESHPRLTGTNAVPDRGPIATVREREVLCQRGRVPEGTQAIEVPLADRQFGGAMRLSLLAGERRRVAAGTPTGLRAGWTRFELPRPLAADVWGSICFEQGSGPPRTFNGDIRKTGLVIDDRIVPGGVTMTYLRPGSERLISMVPVIAERIGRTRGHLGGAWRAFAIAAFFALGVASSAWVLARTSRGLALRRAALVIGGVAVVNALAWSFLTPPLQVPDEHYHLSYVQDLAEHGRPPDGGVDRLADELNVIVDGTALGDINFNSFGRPQWSETWDRELDGKLAQGPSRDNPGASVNVKDYPPLYYSALVPIYAATHALGGSTLDAMTPMRATGALLAGVTVLALFGFLLELFPSRPVLSAGVALICAYQPVFSWISGGINPDALLIALGTTMFWLFARAFRRGLTPGLATALGLVLAACVLTKVAGVGLAPGWAGGMALLLWKRVDGRRAVSAVAGAAAAAVPLAVYAFVNTQLWSRSLLPGAVVGAVEGPQGGRGTQASGFASYVWQYFLPHVGGMTDFFHVQWTPKDFWTPLWVGKFGWFDYQFPNLVNDVAFAIYAVIAVAAVVALAQRLPRLWLPAVISALLAGGLVVAIARAGYPLRASGHVLFEQARYLMPLLALYALALILTVLLLPRRWALAAVAVFLAGSALHLLGAWILTIERYYL